MKGFITVVIIILVVCGFFVWWLMNDNKPSGNIVASNPSRNAGAQENAPKTVPEKVMATKGNLRSMATALESFYVDHNKFPDNLGQLTTPIAYITMIMEDPFNKNASIQYMNKGDKDFIVWSIGPDGKDEQGTAQYNASQGENSGGDIIRTRTVNP